MSGVSLFRTVRQVLQLQMLALLVVASVAMGLGGVQQAKSGLIGGLVGFLPNAWFAWKFGRLDPKKNAKQVIRTFYAGEAVKLVGTALLFAIVFQIPDIQFLPLFAGFLAVITVFWFALLLRN
jgi:ATP synthase protein I